MPITVLRVSQLNRYVRSVLESDARLREIYLRGEITDFKAYPSGHLYFSLRDETASVAAVMFRGNAQALRFVPENGMQVLVRGSVALYETTGKYQVVVSEVIPDGEGARAVALLQLRRKLEAEGLFAPERKRPLPENPAVIGIVTSRQGAVLHDVLSVLQRKAPDRLLLLAAAAVQGAGAAQELARAIALLNADGRSEVILLARGGGSTEDLWSFQEEAVVRAVASSAVPVISAIGHETDTTLCDLAADRRAATPTAAAEIALGGIPDCAERLAQRSDLLLHAMQGRIFAANAAFSAQKAKLSAIEPAQLLAEREKRLYNMSEKLHKASEAACTSRETALAARARGLELVSPLQVLSRGYSVTQKDGRALRRASEAKCGDRITTLLGEGRIASVITEVFE